MVLAYLFVLTFIFLLIALVWWLLRKIPSAASSKRAIAYGKEQRKTVEKWEKHPEFKIIKARASFIEKTLKKDDISKSENFKKTVLERSTVNLLGSLKDISKCIECYQQLFNYGILADIPFYGNRPKGLSKGVDLLLPIYAFPDWIIGKLTLDLTNAFNNNRAPKPEFDEHLRSEMLKTLRSLQGLLHNLPGAKEYHFSKKETDEIILQLERDASYESIQELFKSG